MEKIKSRWRKSYLDADIPSDAQEDDHNNGVCSGFELANNLNSNSRMSDNHDQENHINDLNHTNANPSSQQINRNHNHHHHHHHHHKSGKHSTPPSYEPLQENIHLDKRKNDHQRRKDARSMVCECTLTKEQKARGVMGCMEDCLNRMLMIECGSRCMLGDLCANKRFQRCESAKVEVFKTKKKGWGLRAAQILPPNSFIMEYVGEIIRSKEFRSRVKKYTKQKVKHHYFMALQNDEVIDATMKGNLTRFINHSCEPNCETQKWTVSGDLRIGFFTIKTLQPGDEITFDYQFQRYGRKAQKCYCEAPSCRGYIGLGEQTYALNGDVCEGGSPPQRDSEGNFEFSGFKIPRLNLSQIKAIEKKIDEEEEESANNDARDTTKYPFARNILKTPALTLPAKRKLNQVGSNIEINPKLTKEDHRRDFEMKQRLEEYYNAIEKHYGSAAVEQVKSRNQAIKDELAFCICDYDQYYTKRNEQLGAYDVSADEEYPYPGSYYTTPEGETWFVTIALDRNTKQPNTVILNLNKSNSGWPTTTAARATL